MTVHATGGDTADASGVTNGIEVDFYAGGGNNTLKGGNGHDFLFTSNFQSTDSFDGGAGNDYIFLTQNNQSLDIHANQAHIRNTEVIWLDGASNNSVTLDETDIPVISAATNYLYIVGASDDEANFGGTGWTLLETEPHQQRDRVRACLQSLPQRKWIGPLCDSLIRFRSHWTLTRRPYYLAALTTAPTSPPRTRLGISTGAALADHRRILRRPGCRLSRRPNRRYGRPNHQPAIGKPRVSGSYGGWPHNSHGQRIDHQRRRDIERTHHRIGGRYCLSIAVARSPLCQHRFGRNDDRSRADRRCADGTGLAATQRTTTITLADGNSLSDGTGGPSSKSEDEPDFQTWPPGPINQAPTFTHMVDEPISLAFDTETGPVKPFAAISGAVDDPENGSIQSLVLSVSHSSTIDAASAFSMSFDHGFGHLGLTDLGAQIAADAGLTVTGAGTQFLAIVGFADEAQMSQLLAEVVYGADHVAAPATDFVSAFATDDTGLTSDSFIIAMHLHSQGMLLL